MGIDKINRPYCLDKDDWSNINTYFKGNHKNWELEEFDDFKSKIKSYLRGQQNNRCCYCKKILKYDKKEVDIEHIIPKSKRPFFTFLNYNLALSCPACNTTKSTNLPLVNTTKKTFAFNSDEYLIIHPHFDFYFKHIEIVNDIFIKSKSTKGDWTIKHCGLDSVDKAKDKILDLMATNQIPGNEIGKMLYALTLKVSDPNVLNTILSLIDDIKHRRFILP